MNVARIHGNRSQAQRTDALDGFKSGRYRVLVATDIAARGIDVEALGHVVNFDVPAAAEDYIHRVGRTARAEMTGEAFTFVAPDEADDLRAIERAIGKALPRVTLPDFDYKARPERALEIPIKERIAQIRAQKRLERERAAANAARRAAHLRGGRPHDGSSRSQGGGGGPRPHGGGGHRPGGGGGNRPAGGGGNRPAGGGGHHRSGGGGQSRGPGRGFGPRGRGGR